MIKNIFSGRGKQFIDSKEPEALNRSRGLPELAGEAREAAFGPFEIEGIYRRHINCPESISEWQEADYRDGGLSSIAARKRQASARDDIQLAESDDAEELDRSWNDEAKRSTKRPGE